MPSPTSSTRPTSRTSICEENCSISCCMTEAISSLLNFISGVPACSGSACRYESFWLTFNLICGPRDHRLPGTFQLGVHRAVVDPVADANDDSSDQARIKLDAQIRLFAESFL